MKMNRFIKHGSCLSLMAMLPTMFGPSLMTQPVEAQTAGGSSLVSTDPDDILFWAMAWGISYTSNQYMLMEPSSPDSTLLTVKLVADSGLDYTDPNLNAVDIQPQILAQGSFDISSWYLLDEATVSSIDPVNGNTNTLTTGLYAIAGDFTGSTGFSTPVYGYAARIHGVVEGAVGQEASFYSFLPEGFNLTAVDSDRWAMDQYLAMQVGQAPRGKQDVVRMLTALQQTSDPNMAMAAILNYTNPPFLDEIIIDLGGGGGIQTEEFVFTIPLVLSIVAVLIAGTGVVVAVKVYLFNVETCMAGEISCRRLVDTRRWDCWNACIDKYNEDGDYDAWQLCDNCCIGNFENDWANCHPCGNILPPQNYNACLSLNP